VYLSLGLSVILAFIGAKLILAFLHEVDPAIPHVPTAVSLGVILGVLAITTAASLRAARRDPTRRAHAGSIRGRRPDQAPTEAADAGRTTRQRPARR
jgi:tellurite resistance protein TerC